MNQETTASDGQLDGSIPHFSVRLSPTPRGARLARLLSEQQLRAWELPLERATQIVAELAANAVTHGRVPGRDFWLLLYVVGDRLRIEVTDTRGDRLPRLQRSAGDGESGRGLLLVDALADRWGVAHGRHPRKTVWAEVCFRAPETGGRRPGATRGANSAVPAGLSVGRGRILSDQGR
ncbi:ATP-binding protein [Streptomyces sp. NBC_00557]|uniref:ATP-binding protein n=1 Tax=Streptomyces sp. NBC_00557 TaxID=2975776 RepID=UPI002E813E56|nr:ATP-binding protein [Streptomyces sp. NBC_00557]WUC35287.1 ATP-binding protein [Streptomyces sp. NBC_00557]